LEHDFHLLDADCQTNVGAGLGEQVNHPLHFSKQQVSEDVKHGFTLSSQPSIFVKATIGS